MSAILALFSRPGGFVPNAELNAQKVNLPQANASIERTRFPALDYSKVELMQVKRSEVAADYYRKLWVVGPGGMMDVTAHAKVGDITDVELRTPSLPAAGWDYKTRKNASGAVMGLRTVDDGTAFAPGNLPITVVNKLEDVLATDQPRRNLFFAKFGKLMPDTEAELKEVSTIVAGELVKEGVITEQQLKDTRPEVAAQLQAMIAQQYQAQQQAALQKKQSQSEMFTTIAMVGGGVVALGLFAVLIKRKKAKSKARKAKAAEAAAAPASNVISIKRKQKAVAGVDGVKARKKRKSKSRRGL